MRILGQISYGLYLWHLPVLYLLLRYEFIASVGTGYRFLWLLALGLPFLFVLSTVSYKFIESPFLRSRKEGGR